MAGSKKEEKEKKISIINCSHIQICPSFVIAILCKCHMMWYGQNEKICGQGLPHRFENFTR